MKNKKIISAAAAVCMIISSSHMVFANDKEEVYVTIENNTLSVSDGAPWEGEKISRYAVPVSSGMTVSEATAIALSENELNGAGLESGWVTELAGLNGSATEMGSWMYSVNDYFGGNTCNMQTIEAGDEIVWEYSSSWGSDLGTDYMNADTSLISIDIDGGTLSEQFDGEKTEYYLTLDENTDHISVDPTMKNRYFQARIYKNLSDTDYDSAEYYHHGEEIPVTVGDKITIACGVKGWENGFYYGDQVQTVDEHIYVLEVCAPKEEVYVTVENNTLSVSDGAPWEGEKISRYAVPVSSGMTVSEATSIALSENELNGAGLESGWVTELAGLDGSATEMGSWMYSINDYFGGNTCNMQTVEAGDEIVWEYSSLWGSDLGTDYMNADTSLISIDIEGGTISTRFDGEKTEYYLTLDENADHISVDPTMKNRYFQARIYKNLSDTDYDSAEYYHHGEEVPVTVGDRITIACGVKGWENGFYYGDQVQTVDEHIYVLEVCNSAPYEITAPENSTVQVFSQIKNYNNAEIMMSDSENNGDGTKTVRFDLPEKMKNYTYRVSAENKITKAGYIKPGDSELNITFYENEDPGVRPQYDASSGMGKYAEDSMLLNINSQNYLRLKSGEEYTVRAFRTWQIVNSTTANIIIEPDFHYNIIDGDSVEITEEGNSAVVKAVKSGVSVIEVTYDAIEIGGNTSLGGVYGASDPDRTGLFIVNVDGDESNKITMPEWDTEFDTVYFTGDSGKYEFKPQADSDITVECNGETVEKNDNGSYDLTIKGGNNIVSASCGDTVEYTVIKGGKIEFKDTENGFKINGLHMPLPKMAGVYNPGFGSSVKTQYGDVTSKGAQYDYINNNEVSVTETGTLTDGVIYVKNMGFEKGAHRSITEDGMGPNFNASAYEYSFSSLPDIWVSSGNDIFTACYDENGVMTNVKKYAHIIENDESDRTFVWNSMKPVER